MKDIQKRSICIMLICAMLCAGSLIFVTAKDNAVKLSDFSFVTKGILIDEVYDKMGLPDSTSENRVTYNVENSMVLELHYDEEKVSDIAIVLKNGIRLYADFSGYEKVIGGNSEIRSDDMNAFNKKRGKSITEFSYIKQGTTLEEIKEKSGECDALAGFGLTWWVYKLNDGNLLHLHNGLTDGVLYMTLHTSDSNIRIGFFEDYPEMKLTEFNNGQIFCEDMSIEDGMSVETIAERINLPWKKHVNSISFSFPDESRLVIYKNGKNEVTRLMLRTKDDIHMFAELPFLLSDRYDDLYPAPMEMEIAIEAKENSSRTLNDFLFVKYQMSEREVQNGLGASDFSIGNASFYFLSDGSLVSILSDNSCVKTVKYVNNIGICFQIEFDESGNLLMF